MVPAGDLVARVPIAIRAVHRHQPSSPAQFERDENCAIINVDGRAYVGCLHLTSPMVRVVEKPEPIGCALIAPWYLQVEQLHRIGAPDSAPIGFADCGMVEP